jgi:hypothetical protein
MRKLAFVPLDRAGVVALRAGAGRASYPACAGTTGLAGDLEPDAGAEELEFAALNQAGILALRAASDPRRLVVAAEVDAAQLTDSGGSSGEVSVRDLGWGQVRALFVDEPAAEPLVARARAAAGGSSLADALGLPEVIELLDGSDLLWFAPEELDQL